MSHAVVPAVPLSAGVPRSHNPHRSQSLPQLQHRRTPGAPFSKSEWITPAACGAVIPLRMVHARVSFSPAAGSHAYLLSTLCMLATCQINYRASADPWCSVGTSLRALQSSVAATGPDVK